MVTGPMGRPSFIVEYLEPVPIVPEPLPDELSPTRLRHSLLVLAGLAVAVAAAIALVPGLGSVRERLGEAQPGWLVVAAALQVSSCVSYVVVFRAVFCRRMPWRTSAQIGFAELAVNSVFSVGGAGGLALGAWILRRGGMPAGHIARRTVAFFLLTSLANVGFLALGGLGLATGVLSGAPSPVLGIVAAAAGISAVGLALLARPAARALARRSPAGRIATGARVVGDGVQEALVLIRAREPAIVLGAAGYMLFDVAMLGVGFAAFGNDVPPAGVLLVAYLIGQLGGLIPIPGGVGGVDGGLIGTLVLFGVAAADAAVAVVAYRAILLVVPALLGLPAMAALRRRLRTEQADLAACAPGEQVEVLGAGRVQMT
jgi:uncharacterized membrane protein YbhN (UPF0104 family)